MVIKKCKICGKEFEARAKAKCCSPECSKINQRNLNRKYKQSEKGKAAAKRYRQSDEGKAAQRKYDQSNKGKDRHKRYRQSDKCKRAQHEFYLRNKESIIIKSSERDKKIIAELNSIYDGDLERILKDCPTYWKKREAKMQVWFDESYLDGVIAKIKSTPVCEVTGEKNDLKIHHLYSFNTHPELGNDLANMVRISKTVHDEFHSIYGYGNNTPEQWIEFIEKQYGGD